MSNMRIRCYPRDILAHALLLLVVAALFASSKGGSTPSGGEPPRLGGEYDQNTTQDPFVPEAPRGEPKAKTRPPTREDQARKTDPPGQAPRKQPRRAERTQPQDRPDPTSLTWSDEGTRVAEKPLPNEVEPNPRPVKEMTQQQQEELAQAYYQRWVHSGKIQVRLDVSAVSLSDMEKIVGLFILQNGEGGSVRYQLRPGGEVGRLEGLPRGRLMGDLPASKWPAPLKDLAGRWLAGKSRDALAFYLLSPAYEVRVYRLIGQELRRMPGNPSTAELTLRLTPSYSRDLAPGLVLAASRSASSDHGGTR